MSRSQRKLISRSKRTSQGHISEAYVEGSLSWGRDVSPKATFYMGFQDEGAGSQTQFRIQFTKISGRGMSLKLGGVDLYYLFDLIGT